MTENQGGYWKQKEDADVGQKKTDIKILDNKADTLKFCIQKSVI